MGRSIRRAERSMSKTYLRYDPDQQLLLPAALQEWLPEDHLAYFISDFRKNHLEALGDLFMHVLELCQRQILLSLITRQPT